MAAINSESTPRLCTGTTFSTLYMMSKFAGERKFCLLPFGQLAMESIPCFAGECFRGIADEGISYLYSSWSDMANESTAEHYSRTFPFNPEKVKREFLDIIDDDREFASCKESKRGKTGCWLRAGGPPPLGSEVRTANWNQRILRLRQYRAWDEDDFQRTLVSDLRIWIHRTIKYAKQNLIKMYIPEVVNTTLQKMSSFLVEIEAVPAFRLSEEDKQSILKSYPIVFVSNSRQYDAAYSREYMIARPMKLGRDIQWIATERAHISELKKYLRKNELHEKVEVISFAVLREMGEKTVRKRKEL